MIISRHQALILAAWMICICCLGCGTHAPGEVTYANPSYKHMRELPVNRYDPEQPASENGAGVSKRTAREYETLGDLMLSRKKYFLAFTNYEKALALEPENGDLYCKRAATFLADKNSEGAVREFTLAVEKFPDRAFAHQGLGIAYFYQRDYALAKQSLEQALALNPSLWRAHNFLGMIHDKELDHDAAIHDYESALAIRPDAGFIYNNLGTAWYLKGNSRNASDAFLAAINAGYRTNKVYNNLGLALAELGQYNQALGMFRKGGSEASAYNNLGCIYLEKGDLRMAGECFQKALSIAPKFYTTGNDNLAMTRQALAEFHGIDSAASVPSRKVQ